MRCLIYASQIIEISTAEAAWQAEFSGAKFSWRYAKTEFAGSKVVCDIRNA
jgi:hypothetical protein